MTALLLGGVAGVVGGAFLAVNQTVHLTVLLLGFVYDGGLMVFFDGYSAPDAPPFFWPAVTLILAVAALAAGWVAIIRGVALGWPRRFDRTQRATEASGRDDPVE